MGDQDVAVLGGSVAGMSTALLLARPPAGPSREDMKALTAAATTDTSPTAPTATSQRS